MNSHWVSNSLAYRLHHPSTEKEMESTINDLLKDSTVGIIVVDNSDLAQLSERLRGGSQRALRRLY